MDMRDAPASLPFDFFPLFFLGLRMAAVLRKRFLAVGLLSAVAAAGVCWCAAAGAATWTFTLAFA
jgi:hypothetical protein